MRIRTVPMLVVAIALCSFAPTASAQCYYPRYPSAHYHTGGHYVIVQADHFYPHHHHYPRVYPHHHRHGGHGRYHDFKHDRHRSHRGRRWRDDD